VIEIHERVRGPERLPQFLAAHDFAAMLDEQREDLEGLLLQANPRAALPQLAGPEIEIEDPE
jgi:hypothetical protein